jgi:hypothetical protein
MHSSNPNLPNAAGVASLMASAINTLSAPPVSLEMLRMLRDRGTPLIGTDMIVHAGREWRTARVQKTDDDFRQVLLSLVLHAT